jgi:Na+/melibiose symporter-like transporter
MSKRTIKIFAFINVVAIIVLFVWFRVIPEPYQYSIATEQLVDQSTGIDAEVRLKISSQIREVWKQRAWQCYLIAVSALLIVAVNAAVFFLSLSFVDGYDRPATRPDNQFVSGNQIERSSNGEGPPIG